MLLGWDVCDSSEGTQGYLLFAFLKALLLLFYLLQRSSSRRELIFVCFFFVFIQQLKIFFFLFSTPGILRTSIIS